MSAARSRHRYWDLALAALMLAATAWAARVIGAAPQPLMDDPLDNLLSALAFREALLDLSSASWTHWIQVSDFRPPLTSVIYQPALALMSDHVAAIRATDHVVFMLCTLLLYRMGARLSGRPAGLVAAALFLSYPEIQGWSRFGNADPVIWFTALLLLRVTLTINLRKPWHAALLGLTAGLCLATRLLSMVFMVGPILWLLIFCVRDRRSLLLLFAAGATALAPAGWWYALQAHAVLDNVAMSSQTQAEQGLKPGLDHYLLFGWGWLLSGLVPSLALIWHRAVLPRRQLWLFLLALLVPAAQFTLMWDVWDRYPLALVPICALLAAVALVHLTAPWRPGLRALALVGVAALGALPMLVPSSYAWGQAWARFLPKGKGLMAPQTGSWDGLARAARGLSPGEPLLNIDHTGIRNYVRGVAAGRRPAPARLVELPDGEDPYCIKQRTTVRYIVHTVMHCDPKQDHRCRPARHLHPWWRERGQQLPKRLQVKTRDSNGVEYSLYRLHRPLVLEVP